jgi:hypothetical protein
MALWRFLSSSEEAESLPLALRLRGCLFLLLRRLFFWTGLRGLSSESEELLLLDPLLELSELEPGGDLLFLDFFDLRPFRGGGSPSSSLLIDLVLADPDLDLDGDFPSDLERDLGDFDEGALGGVGSLSSSLSLLFESLESESLPEGLGLGLGSCLPFPPLLFPLAFLERKNFARGDPSGESWVGF